MPSGPEWIIVLVIVLVIFGGAQVPKLARNLGRAQRDFKDGLAESHRDEEHQTDDRPGAIASTRTEPHNDDSS